MIKTPENDSNLRDMMAIERTTLANERTLLSYIRTALALVVTGVSAIHFFNQSFYELLGAVLIAGGSIILIIGFSRFNKVKNLLTK